MARIFTINFNFRGASHAAIVSTLKSVTQAEAYQIMVFDEALHHLAPDGIIRLYMDSPETQSGTSEKEDLVHQLKKAVSGYLHNHTFPEQKL